MLIPADIEIKLGFDKIRARLKSACSSEHSEELVDKIQFTADAAALRNRLVLANEMLRLKKAGSEPPIHYTFDLRDQIKYIKTPGTFLQPSEFLELSKALESARSLTQFFDDRQAEFPYLYGLVNELAVSEGLLRDITDKISENSEVKDTASARLGQIRMGISAARNRLRKSLDRIFRSAVKDGYVPEKSSITVRDGRMVIPVLAEYKRRVPGFIHDESATGQTVFLEPAEVLESNNEIRELEYAEKREVVKILISLTDTVRKDIGSITDMFEILAHLDLLRAKARLSRELEATFPAFDERPTTSLVNARHPLLYLNYLNTDKKVVPLSLQLGAEFRIMIISGPNAGGKSVCLKTVGLIQYMWQCGLLVPVSEESCLGIYVDIFLDIGDEQSIDNDLSTYSSHLTFMKEFLSNAGKNSLILIDEFGTGTDPQFGGAIAEGILVDLIRSKCRGVITTHYGNIKSFAEGHPNVLNGAMKYDSEHLTPLYELQAGIPGSSFTFEVARKIGLPEEIIAYARDVVGSKQTDVEELLLQLEKQEQQIKKRDRELSEKEEETSRLLARYEQLLHDLEENKKLILSKAREEASGLLKQTNREIEKTIRHIKENRAEKKETRKARERLESLKQRVKPDKAAHNKPESKEELRIGDKVQLVGNEVAGEVIGLRGKDVEIQIGALKTTTKRSNLTLISRGGQRKSERKKPVSSNVDLGHKLTEFRQTLDVRGKRASEIHEIVEKFLDDALLFNASELRILHGKGDGVLRQLIRDQLRKHPYVEKAHDEHVDHGGAGITVVQLK